ncbi:hypothetical protein QE152_g40643 [Popillia japonica]|uniref:Uncharacterized protein n=1 Tax=Popillia japonica TaxID=7064 RepID=A0AAW1HFM7_POPJA
MLCGYRKDDDDSYRHAATSSSDFESSGAYAPNGHSYRHAATSSSDFESSGAYAPNGRGKMTMWAGHGRF